MRLMSEVRTATASSVVTRCREMPCAMPPTTFLPRAPIFTVDRTGGLRLAWSTMTADSEPSTNFYAGDRRTPSETLQDLQAEVERLRPLAELGRMAATVAHEVRNPLAGISANAELLREVLDQQEDRESVDIILTEVERLGRLVTDLLHYARERPPSLGPLDLGQVARRTIDLSSQEASAAGVELIMEGGGHAHGDGELSCQALLNIVRNAIQASQVGDCIVLHAAEGCIAVRDQGSGIPANLHDRLFEPFVTGRTRGLGLGAAVARRCLRRQGGDIILRDSGPHGSLFELQWPHHP